MMLPIVSDIKISETESEIVIEPRAMPKKQIAAALGAGLVIFAAGCVVSGEWLFLGLGVLIAPMIFEIIYGICWAQKESGPYVTWPKGEGVVKFGQAGRNVSKTEIGKFVLMRVWDDEGAEKGWVFVLRAVMKNAEAVNVMGLYYLKSAENVARKLGVLTGVPVEYDFEKDKKRTRKAIGLGERG